MTALQKPIEGEIIQHEIAAYNPYRAQIAEMREINAKTVFQYQDPKGNKEARSYIHKLRLSKGEIERVRKAEKAASLEYGRKVDAEAKDLTAEIEAMIAVHQAPLDEIERREEERKLAIENRLQDMRNQLLHFSDVSSAGIKERIEYVSAIIIDASFAEYQTEAEKEKKATLDALNAALADTEKREAEAAELERLRREEEERKRKEREDAIAREAAEKARLEAEARAKAEAEAAEKKAREEREAIERKAREEREAAERAKAEALAKAEAERLEAERKAEAERAAAAKKIADAEAAAAEEKRKAERAAQEERERIQREADAKAAEEAKREADKKHQAGIHADIIKALGMLGISEELAKAAIIAIRKGEVPHIKINY